MRYENDKKILYKKKKKYSRIINGKKKETIVIHIFIVRNEILQLKK